MGSGVITAIILGILLYLFVLVLAMFLLFGRANESGGNGVREPENVAFENPMHSTADTNSWARNATSSYEDVPHADTGYMDVPANNDNGTHGTEYMDIGDETPGTGYMDVSDETPGFDLDGGADHGFDL